MAALEIHRPYSEQTKEQIERAPLNVVTEAHAEKGDTLFALVKRFDTSVPEIKRMNNIKGNTLKVGQVLRFNNKAHAEKEAGNKGEAKTYVVKKGDSLQEIAQRNGSNIDKIMQLNNLSNKDNIQPGQVIVVR